VFSRVLIANRGEVAVRVIRTLHDLGIEAVAVYSTADRNGLHVRMADRAVCVGAPPAAESYLNIPSVIAAATTTRCDAVHPGWGFLAERPAFVRACEENDLVFIGPSADTMARTGDKVEAKMEMARVGMPLIPGTEDAVELDAARSTADEVGYPVLLKAAAGGGGRGMRLVASATELEDVFRGAAAEANAAFGDERLYVEKALVPARHVEVQVLADGEGGVLTLGERECSIQRRHQKLIEESPSSGLGHAQREEMEALVERACLELGYRNAGTFEFLLGPDGGFYFMELNARLQVEHPVTELVTGHDLVREQVRIAAGGRLSETGRAARRGHAIEARINAEDVARDFAPAPGQIERFRAPLGPGVRMDTHVEPGTVVTPYYDSLLGKVIVWDEDRPSAIARGIRALSELELTGVPTTRELAIGILRGEAFGSGRYSTSFLDEAAPIPAEVAR
jgi:acetyl-CoA carboxylase, biotin carboxylase subunit